MSQIAKFFSGKSVFITGATGYMGKVLLVKLLMCMPDIERIYVLLRPKKGLAPKERIEKLLNSMPFTLVPIDGEQLKKVVAVSGDVTEIGLGLSDVDRATIIDTVSIVYHFAASVKFDMPLKQAVLQNVTGTEAVLDLCLKIKNIQSVLHLSTAYCNADIEDAAEIVYDIPNVNPRSFVEMVQQLDEEVLASIETKLISPHPNTYTFTKRIAELLVKGADAKLPLVIVRPSIVMAACHEPVPGWVDSLNGPVGLSAAVGKGVTQIVRMDGDLHMPYVPVDIAVDIVIVASVVRATETFAETPVFHATATSPSTWRANIDYMLDLCSRKPFKYALWHSNCYTTKSKLLYEIGNLFVHILPAILVDFLLIMFLREPFLLKVQKRLYEGNTLLSFFILRPFKFHTENMDSLVARLNRRDREIFNIFERHICDYWQYLSVCGEHSTKYCLNEELRGDFARIVRYYGYYLLDKVLKAWILYTIFKFSAGIVFG